MIVCLEERCVSELSSLLPNARVTAVIGTPEVTIQCTDELLRFVYAREVSVTCSCDMNFEQVADLLGDCHYLGTAVTS